MCRQLYFVSNFQLLKEHLNVLRQPDPAASSFRTLSDGKTLMLLFMMADVTPESETDNVVEAPEMSLYIAISYSDIASKLLHDQLLLTALELHCELTEAGKEVPKLKEFFSNPGNFERQNVRPELSPINMTRWSSQATLDSLDLTRYSEDGEKVIDDKVAVLEFELRKAKETINALRTNLTVATECETPSQEFCDSSKSFPSEPIKPHEQRALNFLINEYLLMHGYRLTSITFSDENEDQDFDVWDDVGLNISKPPELLHLYRDSVKNSNVGHVNSACVEVQTDDKFEDIEILLNQLDIFKERVASLEAENKDLLDNLDRIKSETALETLNSHFAAPVPTSESGSNSEHFVMVDSSNLFTNVKDAVEKKQNLEDINKKPLIIAHSTEDIDSDESATQSIDWLKFSECDSEVKSENVVVDSLLKNTSRHLPSGFQKEILSRCFLEVGPIPGANELEQYAAENTTDRFVHIIAGTLCKIAPTLSSANKEDVILLIVYSIYHHPNSQVREKLLQLLFSLKKKPKEGERKSILAGVNWLATNMELTMLSEELVPHCWENLNDKYVEKRLLVSEMCSVLVPHLPVSSRNSLLLPILQQLLLEDKEDRVRASALSSISLIVTFMDDEDKYLQCEELLITGLQDVSKVVVETSKTTLLPVLTKWAFDMEKLHSHLIPRLLSLLSTHIRALVSHQKGDSGSPFKYQSSVEVRCCWIVDAIRSILPFLVMYIASASTVLQSVDPSLSPAQPRSGFADVCRGMCNPIVFFEGKYGLGEIIKTFDSIVADKMWPRFEFLVSTMIPKLLDFVDQINILQSDLLTSFVSLFYSLSCGFGKIAVDSKIKTIYVDHLEEIESKLANMSQEWPNMSILPVYLLGVLVPLQELEDIQTTFRKFLFILPICGYPSSVLEFCVKELSKINFLEELLLSVLWEGVVHAREVVRCTVIKLFVILIQNASDFTITTRIMPAIVTLSNDSDILVKTATIPVFGQLIKETSIKEVSDKCYFQLQTFLSEPGLFDNHSTLIQLISTLGHIASHCDSTFREDVLVPQLAASAAYATRLTNQTRKQELSRVLLDAYSAVVYCSFTKNTITTALLPGLRCLELICSESIAHRESINSMIKELEAKSATNDSSQSVTSVTTIMGQEVKQRMSKIFQTPISKQNKFWK